METEKPPLDFVTPFRSAVSPEIDCYVCKSAVVYYRGTLGELRHKCETCGMNGYVSNKSICPKCKNKSVRIKSSFLSNVNGSNAYYWCLSCKELLTAKAHLTLPFFISNPIMCLHCASIDLIIVNYIKDQESGNVVKALLCRECINFSEITTHARKLTESRHGTRAAVIGDFVIVSPPLRLLAHEVFNATVEYLEKNARLDILFGNFLREIIENALQPRSVFLGNFVPVFGFVKAGQRISGKLAISLINSTQMECAMRLVNAMPILSR